MHCAGSKWNQTRDRTHNEAEWEGKKELRVVSGHNFPDLLPPTIYQLFYRHSVTRLEQIYSTPRNNIPHLLLCFPKRPLPPKHALVPFRGYDSHAFLSCGLHALCYSGAKSLKAPMSSDKSLLVVSNSPLRLGKDRTFPAMKMSAQDTNECLHQLNKFKYGQPMA